MERKEIGTGQDKGHSPKSRVKSQPGGKSKWKFVLWAIMKSIDWWAGGEQTCKLPLKLTKSTESRVWGVEKQSLKSSIDWQQTLPPLNQWQRPWLWRRKLKKKKGVSNCSTTCWYAHQSPLMALSSGQIIGAQRGAGNCSRKPSPDSQLFQVATVFFSFTTWTWS